MHRWRNMSENPTDRKIALQPICLLTSFQVWNVKINGYCTLPVCSLPELVFWDTEPAQGPALFRRHSIVPQLSDFSVCNTFSRTEDYLRPENKCAYITPSLNENDVPTFRARTTKFLCSFQFRHVIGAHGWSLVLLSQYCSSLVTNICTLLIKHLNTIGGALWIFSGFKDIYIRMNALIPEKEGPCSVSHSHT